MATRIEEYEIAAAATIAKVNAVQIPNGYYMSGVCFFTILNRAKAALGAGETVTDAVYDAVTLAFKIGYLKGGAPRCAESTKNRPAREERGMIKGFMMEDALTPAQLKECDEAFAVEPSEGYEIPDELLNALELYLAIKVNPECDVFVYDEAAADVIVTAFRIGFLRGGRAAKEGKFKEP